MSEKIIVSKEIAGRTLSLETGALAKQAGASVLVRYGDTVVLAAVTASSKPREGIDFFPLVVDFEEKFYAAGKIPGGFIKREGRPSEKSILSGRMIDRSIRPLFPEGLCHEVQVVATVLSTDQENDADILGLIAASAALTISDIPFNGPIAAARIGRLGEEFIVNPTLQQIQESSLNLVLSASKTSIAMVEAGAHELSEELMLQAFELAQTECHKIVELIEELAAQAAKPKRAFPLSLPDKDLESFMRTHLSASIAAAMRILNKKERNEAFDKITKEALIAVIQETGGSMREQLLGILMDDKRFDFAKILDKIQEEELRKMIVNEKLRSDGRQFDEIRPITCEVAVLPRTHGSSIFTRGETQVLNAVTLGTVSDEQIIDGLGLEDSKRYMHQYNFPPYSVGEVKPLRGPGRREIGHGALAERALIPMLPSEEEFPYTLRLVSEVLESNGSSSMASTCASTLALMDAGVPIKKPVAGIAMGLVELEHDFVVLTDIQGLEDHLGDMDFKVTGTRDGITALQMDIKLQGISQAVLQDALAKARNARLFILDKMTACIAEPRADLSPYAPRIIMMTIDVEKIKDVIGSGGKVINKIIADTGVKIDIENDGRVLIASVNQEAGEKARAIIENIVKVPEIGEVYLGKAVRLMNFGVFVEFAPGKEGLVHISQLAPYRVEKVEDIVKVGDEFPVKIMEIDPQGKINLSRKALLPGAVEDEDNGGGRHPRHGKYNGGGRPSRFRH